MKKRLGIFVTHPVQYHVPIWRSLANTEGLDVKVFYFSDVSIRGGIDPGFGVPVAWDVPLLEGYESHFISRDADITKFHKVRIHDPKSLLKKEIFDYVLINGYMYAFERQVVKYAKSIKAHVILRGELTDAPRPGRGKMQRIYRDIYLSWFYKHVDRFCYVGKESKRHLERVGVPSKKMFCSPYSVDNNLFELQKQQFKRSECRSQLSLNDDQFTFLFSGKMVPRKMPLLLAEAVLRLPENNKIALIMLGEGPQRKTIETLLHPILKYRLVMPGFINQSELGKYFMASDALILPSNYETWGLVVNEAMIFSLPVITSDAVGCRHDLVIPGHTGYVFQSGNVRSLIDAMQKMLVDPQKTKNMGSNAENIIKNYSISASVKGIIEAINS